jgi:hypothetical protein
MYSATGGYANAFNTWDGASTSTFSYLVGKDGKNFPMQLYGFASNELPSPTSSDYGLNATSTAANQDFGFFGNMLRDVLIWLFRPDVKVQQLYQLKKEELLDMKSPFAYFNQSISLIESVSSTVSSTGMTVNIPTQWGDVPLFSSNTIKTSSLFTTVTGNILFWERIVMWIGFLFWLYETLKELKV